MHPGTSQTSRGHAEGQLFEENTMLEAMLHNEPMNGRETWPSTQRWPSAETTVCRDGRLHRNMSVDKPLTVYTQVTETWPSTHKDGRPRYVCMNLRNTVSSPHFRLSSSTVLCGSVRSCAVLCSSVKFCMAHPVLFDTSNRLD